jgi:plasmid replication initiation protein
VRPPPVTPGRAVPYKTDMDVVRERSAQLRAEQDAKEPDHAAKPPRQLDLFVAEIFDVSIRDEMHTMEHPFFSLSKRKDTTIREFTAADGSTTRVIPSAQGLATIWDKDLLIFAVSKLMGAHDQGARISKYIKIRSADLFSVTRRSDGGESYRRLRDTLVRLNGTQIVTQIVAADGTRSTKPFRWIEEFEIVDDKQGKVLEFTIVLPHWLYVAVLGEHVLSIAPEYFELEGGLERRLYGLARKHVGIKTSWPIRLKRLYEKSGWRTPLRQFKHKLKKIAEADCLPDYSLTFDEKEENPIVLFNRRRAKLPA